jgi:NifB/MoaA-like Fe-S oxidoreductase
VAAAPFLRELLAGLPVDVIAAENSFFGKTVTVAGLLTGRDVLSALRDRPLGARVLIPSVMLRHGTSCFLDGMTAEELEAALGAPVAAVEADGEALAAALSN